MKHQHQTRLLFEEKKPLEPFCFLLKVWIKGSGWREHSRCADQKDLREELKKLEALGHRTSWNPLY